MSATAIVRRRIPKARHRARIAWIAAGAGPAAKRMVCGCRFAVAAAVATTIAGPSLVSASPAVQDRAGGALGARACLACESKKTLNIWMEHGKEKACINYRRGAYRS